jgi:hypothetical protein
VVWGVEWFDEASTFLGVDVQRGTQVPLESSHRRRTHWMANVRSFFSRRTTGADLADPVDRK